MFEYWFDADEKAHLISKMDITYISNCLQQLSKMLYAWRGIVPEQLTAAELKQKYEVGKKAWFVFNGVGYIDAFSNELKKRK